jgi:hypothetical protein
MNGRPWTDKELDYFEAGYTDAQIVEKTGRTAKAVNSMRYKLMHEGRKEVEPYYSALHCAPCTKMTQAEKIQRIRALQLRYGVKLKEGKHVR